MRSRLLLSLIAIPALFAACGGDGEPSPAATGQPSASPRTAAAISPGVAFSLTSDAFEADSSIPARFTCDGENLSPALSWDDPPEATRSLALIMSDPDAPGGTFTHWVLYGLEADTRLLPTGVETEEQPTTGGVQGRNDGGKTGYTGPCPPSGPAHHYAFTLYALSEQIDLDPGASAEELLEAMQGSVVGTTQLTGTYQRE